MDEKGLGQRIGSVRRAAGITQQMLCHKADLSYSTLAKIERGAIKAPSIFTIQRIANALDYSLEEILGQATGSKSKKKKSTSGVSFVYFDVNGCLVHFFHRAFTKLSELSGQPTDIIETIYWHYNDQVCRGEVSLDEFNKKLSKKLNMPGLNWRDYYFATIDPVPGMNQLLSWVAENYKIGLLTNSMPGFLDQLIKLGFVPDLEYDAIVDSSLVGSIKPEVKIYDTATKKAGCPSDEILLIDDSRTNLMAADKFKWHVSWFDDYNSEESIERIKSSLQLEGIGNNNFNKPPEPSRLLRTDLSLGE